MKAFIIKRYERLDAQGEAIKELGTGLRNMEMQVGKIATILSERVLGTLPADTEKNPKEIVNVVTLRSGQVLKDPIQIQKEVILEKESGEQLKNDVDKKKKGPMKTKKKKYEEKSRREKPEKSEHMSALPFPQKLCREMLGKQFERFLDVLKQVHVNLPFIEVLSQMPAYAKKLEKEIEEIRSAPISLQLADQMTITLEGIVEDMLVWVDKFVFPVDFIVVNMEENKEVSLIIGRPFLATGKSILDIHERKLTLIVGEETLNFEMNVAKGAQKEKSATSVEWKFNPE
ncbi:uncharacterized protein [Nicotiana tomentosiformis]|uniref:uncharacterized protein n=1 Tax=Nicotiana tomentosiformis TaxID=4098 RepID=UPI00388C9031